MSRWPMIMALALPFSLILAVPSFAQDDLRGGIASCASVMLKPVRLRCYDAIAKGHRLGPYENIAEVVEGDAAHFGAAIEAPPVVMPLPRSKPRGSLAPETNVQVARQDRIGLDDRESPFWLRRFFPGGWGGGDPESAAQVSQDAQVSEYVSPPRGAALSVSAAEEAARQAYEEEQLRLAYEAEQQRQLAMRQQQLQQYNHQRQMEQADPLMAMLGDAVGTPNGTDGTVTVQSDAVPLTQSEQQIFLNQLSLCWRIGEHTTQIVTVRVSFSRDGRAGNATLLTGSGLPAELALNALRNPACQPFPLPPKKHGAWQQLDIVFGPGNLRLQ